MSHLFQTREEQTVVTIETRLQDNPLLRQLRSSVNGYWLPMSPAQELKLVCYLRQQGHRVIWSKNEIAVIDKADNKHYKWELYRDENDILFLHVYNYGKGAPDMNRRKQFNHLKAILEAIEATPLSDLL